MSATCEKKVSYFQGAFFWPCGKPAKYRVVFNAGAPAPYHVCGIHARTARRMVDRRVEELK